MPDRMNVLIFVEILINAGLVTESVEYMTATPLRQEFTSHETYGSSQYPEGNYTKDWSIGTDWVNHTIGIDIVECDIEQLSKPADNIYNCATDFIYIYDGSNSSSELLGRICCLPTDGRSFESSGDEMYVLFITGNTVSADGFKIEFWSDGITTTTSTTAATPQSTSVNILYIIAGVVAVILVLTVIIIILCIKKTIPRTRPQSIVVKEQKSFTAEAAKTANTKLSLDVPKAPTFNVDKMLVDYKMFDLEFPYRANKKNNVLPPLSKHKIQ